MNRRRFVGLCALIGYAVGGRKTLRIAQAASPSPRVHNAYEGLATAAAHEIEETNLAQATAAIDSLISGGPFQADWASLHTHRTRNGFAMPSSAFTPIGDP